MLWGQETVLSPLTGWGSLILQGGAFALLSIVVVWLWPREMREQREERKQRDERMTAMTNAFAATLTGVVNTLQDKFEDRNNRVVTAIGQQTEKLEKGLKDSADRIENAVRNSRDRMGGT